MYKQDKEREKRHKRDERGNCTRSMEHLTGGLNVIFGARTRIWHDAMRGQGGSDERL